MYRYTRLFLSIVVLAAMAGHQPSAAAAVRAVDRIVAVVNDDVITQSEFDNELKAVTRDLRSRGAAVPKLEVLQRQALERMIVERLQLQYAERAGIVVSDGIVDEAEAAVAKQNNLSRAELAELLARDGIEYMLFRETLRKRLTIRRLIEREINSQVTVTPEEIDGFLAEQRNAGGLQEEYDVSHILVTVSESASGSDIEAARQRASEALDQIHRSVDFEQVATEYSDAQDALNGGRLGWRKAGQLPALFLGTVQQLEPGEASDVLQSANGFHIVKLNAKRGGARQVVVQSRVRHILIRPSEFQNETEVRNRMLQVRQRILNGEDFDELARLYSEDNLSRTNGGQLGWMNPGETVPEFEQIMNALEPGEISRPMRTQFGLHLIEVMERREKDVGDALDRNSALEQIRERKSDENYERWVRQLRDESFVEYRVDQL